MSDSFDHIFQNEEQPTISPQAPVISPEEAQPTQIAPKEEIDEYDNLKFPTFSGLQIILVLIIVALIGGFGFFYANRTSAQNNLSSSSLTPIPTQADSSFSIPSQQADTSTHATQQSAPPTNTTEGGQPIAPTPTMTATTVPTATATPTHTPTPTSPPAPTATNTPVPTATPTVAPTATPTETPTDTPTP